MTVAWAIANFRTSRFIGVMSWAPLRWVQWWALTVFEVRQQFKDPITWLYALVFILLAAGFTSGGGVELVGSRGGVPASSAWSLWLAFGGLTAFGQVITTMVAPTSAVLPDGSNGGETSTTSPPIKLRLRKPRNIRSASRVVIPPGSGVPVPGA